MQAGSNITDVRDGSLQIVITAPGFDIDHPETGARLRTAGYSINHVGFKARRSPAEMAELLADASAVIASADPITRDVFARAPALRVVARFGAGYDAVDVEAATDAGVVVTIAPGLNAATVADHAIALMLACLRKVPQNDAGVRLHGWGDLRTADLGQLTGRRVGLIGLGNIGTAVMRRLRGFEAELRVFDPFADLPAVVSAQSLDELLQWSDVVSLHTPLLDSTRHMIGERELALLGPRGILVNTSRGGLIDEEALLTALASGTLAGAGLDVFDTEPPFDSPLLLLSNVVVSPHVGGLSAEANRRVGARCVEQVLDILAGRSTSGVVNPEALLDPSSDRQGERR